MLIKPVQRVLKYPLLVDKLVESTVTSHPDYKAAHTAKETIAKVAQDINEIKRRKDLGKLNLVKILTRGVSPSGMNIGGGHMVFTVGNSWLEWRGIGRLE